MKKLFIFAALLLAFSLAFVSCNKDENEITNTMTLRGEKLPIRQALYAPMGQGQDGVERYNLDVNTTLGADNILGYTHEGFPASYIGKTTELSGDFFLNFNPMEGNTIYVVIKSGTMKIKEVKGGLHFVVDCVETNGEKFYMNFLAEDETKKVWD